MESITKRRRFQAPITHFFDSHSDDDSTATHLSNSSSTFPTLPPSTQSSLLTVGCRVRKSVPEGYKTHTTVSGGFTPRPFMNSRLSPATLAAITAPAKYSALTPYAGASTESAIHDIGGLPAIQPLATTTFCGISLRHMPSSSSPSSSPPYSSPSSSHSTHKNKRAFDDSSEDDDEDDDVIADFIPQLPPSAFSSYLPASSTAFASHHRRGSSYPFKHTTMPDLNALSASAHTHPALRKFAQPKSRIRLQAQGPASPEQENFGFFGGYAAGWDAYEMEQPSDTSDVAFGGCGYEMHLESAAAGGMDFGEPGFLRRRDEVEMDCS